jgi:putative hydrolase of the HAD superfamily
MIKAILFDLDNTLIDFMKMKKASCEAAVEAMIDAGIKLDKQNAMKILFELYDKYGIEYNKIFQKFLTKINRKIDYKILAAGIVAYRKVQSGLLEPYPNVRKVLLTLKERGLKLGIVSDAPRLKAWIRLTELQLQDFFDVVVAFGDVEEKKPSRLPFEKAIQELALDPKEVLMIGDLPEKDIAGAKKLGMLTCFARYGNAEAKESGADFEINSFSKILDVLEQIKNLGYDKQSAAHAH